MSEITEMNLVEITILSFLPMRLQTETSHCYPTDRCASLFPKLLTWVRVGPHVVALRILAAAFRPKSDFNSIY